MYSYKQLMDPDNNLYDNISVSCSYYIDVQFSCGAAQSTTLTFSLYISMLELSKRTLLKSKAAFVVVLLLLAFDSGLF